MARDSTYQINPPDDFELGTPRTRRLTYQVAVPDDGEALGLVFFIRGFGEDNNAQYAAKMRAWMADTHGYACATVDHHAIANRPHNGGRVVFEDMGKLVIGQQIQKHKLQPNLDINALLPLIKQANDRENQQRAARGEPPEKVVIPCAIYPSHDEFQNFGVLQALDHLAAFSDLRQRIDFDPAMVIALGSSHGGYIANMMTKLAPGLLTAVFDNSSYATPPRHYLCGEEAGQAEWTYTLSPTCFIPCYVKSAWTFKPDQPNTYHPDAAAMRSFLERDHLETMAEAGGTRTQYRFIHAHEDAIAPPEEKRRMVGLMRETGMDVALDVVTPDRVDGQFIKDMDHGMGLSLRSMFERMIGTVAPREANDSWAVAYEGERLHYAFQTDGRAVRAEMADRSH